MICIQKPTSLIPQPDTMAGYAPDKLSRTQATARYISFSYVLRVFCLSTRTFVVRSFVLESKPTSTGFHKDSTGISIFPGMDPAGLHRVPVTICLQGQEIR
jgi:hypothetical protein